VTFDEPLDFRVAVRAVDGRCLAHDDPADCEGEIHAHHVVYQQTLRKLGLSELRWDPHNGMALCERAHRRHHSGHEKLRRDQLPQRCVDFAEQHGLAYVLDRFYAPPA